MIVPHPNIVNSFPQALLLCIFILKKLQSHKNANYMLRMFIVIPQNVPQFDINKKEPLM